jgi:citronellol/citronellal dehydrogenase
MSLKGKTLFITGASRGIGLAIALRAARDGANIAIAAKTETPHPKLEGTAAEVDRKGRRPVVAKMFKYDTDPAHNQPPRQR